MALAGYVETPFSYQGVTHPVFRTGTGPGIVIMPEIPGLTPKTAELGRTLANSGFTVFIPSLFGTPGKKRSIPYAAVQMARVCISREFHVLASNHSSPVTDWLRAFCRQVHTELGGPGVGALGLCLTGNFALALMVDPAVMAPVLSEPALPFPFLPSQRRALHISQEQLKEVKERASSGVGVLGLRFTKDLLCPGQRFKTLERELGENFDGIKIDSSWGNPDKISILAHSVLTEDFEDKEGHPTRDALDRVIDFFQERLISVSTR